MEKKLLIWFHGDVLLNYKKNNMKLCHYNSDDNIECGTANYTYEGGILNIKDNDWYLKGKYYVTLEDANMLILKQEISKEEQTIIYYKKKLKKYEFISYFFLITNIFK